jgi:hypothetical protein
MRTGLFFLLLCFATCYTSAQDSIPTRVSSNRFYAAQEIKALKRGALVVRLKTNDKSVDAYRKAGQNNIADKIVADRLAMNLKIMDAFKYNFTFCKVYFIYAKNTDALLKHQPNIFLNSQLQPDSSIHMKEDYFLIAEYGSFTSNERVDDYHYSGVYHTEPSSSTASTSALVMLDTTLTQLQEPFPFAVPVYLGGYNKAVEQMDRQLTKLYDRFRYEDAINLEKLKKEQAPKK